MQDSRFRVTAVYDYRRHCYRYVITDWALGHQETHDTLVAAKRRATQLNRMATHNTQEAA